MLSKAQIKHITALRTKKYRIEHSQFFVEGKKCIQELINSNFEVIALYYTQKQEKFIAELDCTDAILTNEIAYSKISNQKQPEGICAVVGIPTNLVFDKQCKKVIALDAIRDPGNLGTIIRIADWFGVDAVICSEDCVELYNNKVIQASMGSVFHIPVYYLDLAEALQNFDGLKLAATLAGEVVYNYPTAPQSMLVIGNEANGISDEIFAYCNEQISIPASGKAESLNAAMACGIISSYLFR